MMDEWRSIHRGGMGEIEEKKSRFIATIEPVFSEEEAAAFIAAIRKKYWDARHNCSAFIIGDSGQKSRCSDDGEPSGTAGRPMLDVLEREHVTNVCVVVTRYFGGTLLGTGGLVRAYSSAVKAGLDNCEMITRIKGVRIAFSCEYNDIAPMQSALVRDGHHMENVEYAGDVSGQIITEDEKGCIRLINDITSGRARLDTPEDVTFAITDGGIMIFDS